jgi:hypothetical protein
MNNSTAQEMKKIKGKKRKKRGVLVWFSSTTDEKRVAF